MPNITKLIDRYIDNKCISVVQIGSNDGILNDPIYNSVNINYKWNVVFVEPVVQLFNSLKLNYGNNSRYKFENSAINDGTKQLFYYVDCKVTQDIPSIPHWCTGVSSFYKSHILKHLDGVLEPYIKTILIQGLTLNELFIKHNIRDLMLLHIDTEGYDWKVLKQLDLTTHSPNIIMFEIEHLKTYELQESINMLSDVYYLFKIEMDAFCIKKTIILEEDYKSLLHRLITIF